MMVKSNKTNAVTPRYYSKNMKRSRQHPNSNNASTSSGRAVVAPTSPVAMGKALVLLATSCAALSSSHHHHHPPQPVATSTTSSQRRGGRSVASSSSFRPLLRNNRLHRDNDGHGEFHSSMVALHYRDGDDDQPVDVREANRNAVDDFASSASATGKSDIRARASSLPSLNLFTFPLPSIMPLVRINLPSMPSSPILTKEEKEQLLMDEYIEFAEKRYSRMHPEYQGRRSQPKHHPKKQAGGRQGSSNHQEGDGGRSRVVLDFTLPRKIFLSTLSLHRSAPLTILPTMASSSSSSSSSEPKPTQEEIEEEDPLNVLGLSDLASARLRQRLHVPRDLRDEHMLIASSTQSAVNFLTYCVNTGRPLVHAHPSAEGKEVSSSSSSTSSSDAVAADGGRTSSYIALSFPAQFKLLVGTMRRLLVAFVRTVRIMTAFAKRACEEILNKGGFRNTVQLASVASVAILFMFKPLFKGAMKQG